MILSLQSKMNTTCCSLFIILCVFISASTSIRCYVCSTQNVGSLYADRCGDDFRLTSIDASRCYNEGSCQKTRGYRMQGSRRVVEVTRGCVEAHKEGCYDGEHNGISAEICHCNEEYCNHSSAVKGSFWMLIFASALGLFMLRRTLG